MHLDIYFDDGTLADVPEVLVSGRLVLTAQRRRDMVLADQYLRMYPGKSVVLVKNERIVGSVFGHDDWPKAFDEVKKQFREHYARYHWQMPGCGVVAAMRPFPAAYLNNLVSVGVDTIYSPGHLRGDRGPLQESIIEQWVLMNPPAYRISVPIRAFVLRHYRAKEWEYSL